MKNFFKFNSLIKLWDLLVNYVAELCALFVGQSPSQTEKYDGYKKFYCHVE